MTAHTITIRLGAAAWDATLADGTHWDFRAMDTNQRKQWYGAFMDSVRAFYRKPRHRPRHRRGGWNKRRQITNTNKRGDT